SYACLSLVRPLPRGGRSGPGCFRWQGWGGGGGPGCRGRSAGRGRGTGRCRADTVRPQCGTGMAFPSRCGSYAASSDAVSDEDLALLAEEHGVATAYEDWRGRRVRVGADTLRHVLCALGEDASDPRSAMEEHRSA